MIFYPNVDGFKYFIYLSTIGRDICYLPQEIREIIWEFYEKKAYMICNLNNNIEIKLSINIKH